MASRKEGKGAGGGGGGRGGGGRGGGGRGGGGGDLRRKKKKRQRSETAAGGVPEPSNFERALLEQRDRHAAAAAAMDVGTVSAMKASSTINLKGFVYDEVKDRYFPTTTSTKRVTYSLPAEQVVPVSPSMPLPSLSHILRQREYAISNQSCYQHQIQAHLFMHRLCVQKVASSMLDLRCAPFGSEDAVLDMSSNSEEEEEEDKVTLCVGSGGYVEQWNSSCNTNSGKKSTTSSSAFPVERLRVRQGTQWDLVDASWPALLFTTSASKWQKSEVQCSSLGPNRKFEHERIYGMQHSLDGDELYVCLDSGLFCFKENKYKISTKKKSPFTSLHCFSETQLLLGRRDGTIGAFDTRSCTYNKLGALPFCVDHVVCLSDEVSIVAQDLTGEMMCFDARYSSSSRPFLLRVGRGNKGVQQTQTQTRPLRNRKFFIAPGEDVVVTSLSVGTGIGVDLFSLRTGEPLFDVDDVQQQQQPVCEFAIEDEAIGNYLREKPGCWLKLAPNNPRSLVTRYRHRNFDLLDGITQLWGIVCNKDGLAEFQTNVVVQGKFKV